MKKTKSSTKKPTRTKTTVKKTSRKVALKVLKTAKRVKVAKKALKTKKIVQKKSAGKAKPQSFLTQYGFFGVMAGVALIGFGLWQMEKPIDNPAPAEIHAQNTITQPVAPTPHVPVPPPAPVAVVPAKPDPLAAEFNGLKSANIADRVSFWSNYLWKNHGPGEKLTSLENAPKIDDNAPLIPKRFDCTTFVETVAALARSHHSGDFFKNLLAIRYKDGHATFEDRNHFPVLDWIANNEKAGILKDITASFARDMHVVARTEKKTVNRGKWLAEQVRNGKVSRSIASVIDSNKASKWKTSSQEQVSYISLKDVPKILGRIPNGVILNLVRKSDNTHPVLVSHQGVLIRENGVVLLRHASIGGNVRTVVLADYLARVAREDSSGWPVVGINLNQLSD